MAKKVGFIGLGMMGKPMAKCILKAGFPLTVFDAVPAPVEEMRGLGAAVASSPKEVARASDIVITMVRDDAQTQQIVLDKSGVLEGAKAGSAIILMSTLSPLFCQRVAAEASKKGVGVLDAPVSGSAPAAEAGTLAIMVGGKEELLKECRPVLEAMGKNIFYFGNVGMGEAAKLANNTIVLVNIFAATEGLALGVKAGIDIKRLLEMIKVSTGNSWVIERWDLIAGLKKSYKPGATMDIMYKDMSLALKLAKELNVDMPLANLATKLDVGRLP